jgi:hypothetical protein
VHQDVKFMTRTLARGWNVSYGRLLVVVNIIILFIVPIMEIIFELLLKSTTCATLKLKALHSNRDRGTY